MALSKPKLDSLKYNSEGPKRQVHYDGARSPGFGVRVHPTGTKTFVLQYRPPGRSSPTTLSLGTYGPDMTLNQARKEAHRLRQMVLSGVDPAEERRKARMGETVADLAELYLDRHAKPHKKTWPEDERRIKKRVLPALGRKKIADVKRPDVARLHNKIGKSAPYEANRVLALVAVMFGKAEEWGMVAEGTPNPAARVQPFREKQRDRWITPAELPMLVQAIDGEPSLHVRTAIKLYLLTGLRRGELLGLRWRDIDLQRREIRLDDTKAGRSHVVPLSPEAMEILGGLPRGFGKTPVFPGNVPGKPLVNISKSWRRIRARFWLLKNPEAAAELRAKAAARPSKHAVKDPEHRLYALAREAMKGEEDVRLHDLRRTVGSWLAASGSSLPLIGKVLNHSNASTTQIYARLAEDATRTALEEHGRRIGPMLTGSDPA